MQRRSYLKLLATSAAGLSAAPGMAIADTGLDCGVWYDGNIDANTDGDTFDVYVYETGQTYNVRNLGFDTPETPSNSTYEKTQEWEFIEDQNHLETWGTNAKNLAQDELPAGTEVQVQHDCNSEKVDVYGRALMRIKYDKSGDGSMNTIWGKRVLQDGYGRVYAASMSETDEYLDLQETARANGAGVWSADDGSASEVKNNDVAETFHPHTSSIKTTGGALADSRAPLWAESDASQDKVGGGVKYNGSIPLVGVDEGNNLAYFGGQPINEEWESDSEALEHFVFVTNLIQHLNGGRAGHVLVDGGHHTFSATHALAGEDVAWYQRFLEGQGIELHSINTYGDSTGYSLADARALIVTGGDDAWTSAEVSEVANFISNGGAVLLMGSHAASSTKRSNLDSLAADLGTDLRLNSDEVHDSTNNVGNQDLLATTNFNTTDFSLWTAYSESGSSNSSPSCSTVSPNDGATVSGTVTIQVDASDSEDADDTLDVDVSIDGGSWLNATYNSTSGYYEYDWDSTGVSDGSHTIDARATDSNGATTSASQITVTVDNVESAPTVDSLSAAEVETSDSDAEFDADWSVSDGDGDLDSVDLVLDDTTAGTTEDSVTVSVSGDTASGTTRLVAAGDDGSGNSYDVTATVSDSNGNSNSSTVSATETEAQILDADPDSAGATSYHTWTLADPSDDYAGEVDTITVDYPSGTSLDGLTDADVYVYMDRDGDGTVDEIAVNSDSYSGSTDTFDLDGRYNTSVEGEVRVEIDGVTNPSEGNYTATETLDGDDTLSVDADFTVSGAFAVSTAEATDVLDTSATLNGSLDDLDGADSADCYFEWRQTGASSWNTTSAQTLSSTGSFSESISGLSESTDYEFRALADASDGDSDTGSTLTFTTSGSVRTDVLTADPNTAGSSSYHTWTLSDPSSDFSGEVDTITVDYPSGTSLDGLTDADVYVYMDRDGDGTVDEIRVNSDSYSGSTDTFDLDGRYNTSVEGEVRVEIDGVTNPSAGDYVATETLDGDDTLSVDAEFVVQ